MTEGFVSIDAPTTNPENFPSMTTEDGSVSTFHPIVLHEDDNLARESNSS
jgi:hypothetical protein